MTAQPHQPAQPYVPQMTIKSVRGALAPDQRPAFNEEIEAAGLGSIRDVLQTWHTRAVLHADRTAETAFASYRAEGVPTGAVAWSAR